MVYIKANLLIAMKGSFPRSFNDGFQVEKSGMEQNMQALSSRVEDIRTSLEQKAAAAGGEFYLNAYVYCFLSICSVLFLISASHACVCPFFQIRK